MSALLSFLSGSVFRMVWGEVSAYLTRRQEHSQEVERMRLQGELDAAQHARNLESIRVQAELGVKEIRVKAEAAIEQIETDAWAKAVDSVGKLTGIYIIDLWNQCIRPLLATLSILVVVAQIIQNGWMLSDWDKELVAAILGLYVADRSLSKRGK